ncbi:MAG: glucose-1-phosphate adenylyltransferase subunit GlgD [Clostridia bacterium]|nr:glucose-1-phosphate adenylyltransferase subunit GlgD [Clostridia bacterium]MBQ7375312.1 glucose-1-phosphate adenylyltransferase subunit GlgD [Clostridia bacterium]
MAVAGLIFSNIHNSSMPELTSVRTMASVPYGCRYRLIDFPLSNMVNSGISKIGIIAHNNYQSLMDHIGTGKDWDLARRSGGIRILPPFIASYNSANGGKLYTTRLEALMGVTSFISKCTEEYIVLSDCDGICTIDLNEVLADHIKKNADITIVTRPVSEKKDIPSDGATEIKCDENGFATEVSAYIEHDRPANISTNIMIANRLFLLNAVNDASAHGYSHFYKDIIARRVKSARINCYQYDGIYLQITSLESYFRCSMQLLEPEVRHGLFVEENPIYTKLRNSAPTVYAEGSQVKNSYVADGCVIEGTVENSIIFRGVHIGKGTVVKNSILLQDTYTGDNVNLNCVITDKNVVIRNNRVLSGHESMPFFISKGAMV